MALTFDLSAITAREGEAYIWPGESFDPASGSSRMNGTTECLIWATMIVGQPTITAENAQAFYARLAAFEAAAGAISSSKSPLGFEDVWRHRGLRTNASTMTEPAWRKKLAGLWADRAKRAAEASAVAYARQLADTADREAGQ